MRINLNTEAGQAQMTSIINEMIRKEDERTYMILDVLTASEEQLDALVRSDKSDEYWKFFSDYTNKSVDPENFYEASDKFTVAFETWLFSDLDDEEEATVSEYDFSLIEEDFTQIL